MFTYYQYSSTVHKSGRLRGGDCGVVPLSSLPSIFPHFHTAEAHFEAFCMIHQI